MCRTDPAHRLLIQHSVPVTGGASGSPLIDPSGKVIGIVDNSKPNFHEMVDDIEALRILKVDVLGLGMLTCIRKALDMLRLHGVEAPERGQFCTDAQGFF